TVIGQAYDALGEPTIALIHLRRALELRDGPTGGTPEQLYDILYAFMYAARDAGPESWTVPRGGIRRVALSCERAIGADHPRLAEPCAEILGRIQRLPTVSTKLESAGEGLRREVEGMQNAIDELLRRSRAELGPGDPTWILVGDFCFGTATVFSMF